MLTSDGGPKAADSGQGPPPNAQTVYREIGAEFRRAAFPVGGKKKIGLTREAVAKGRQIFKLTLGLTVELDKKWQSDEFKRHMKLHAFNIGQIARGDGESDITHNALQQAAIAVMSESKSNGCRNPAWLPDEPTEAQRRFTEHLATISIEVCSEYLREHPGERDLNEPATPDIGPEPSDWGTTPRGTSTV
jgi:hypothetical protein